MQENTEVDINELKEENALLLYQLHQVQEELEKIYLENQRLKNNSFGFNARQNFCNDETAYGKLYGAADRIRNDPAYKLGRKFIENSKSIKGWAKIINVWIFGSRKLRRGNAGFKEKDNLPPISSYADASEADRVKKHLSYRIGNAILTHNSSFAWMILPFHLYKIYADFKKEALE